MYVYAQLFLGAVIQCPYRNINLKSVPAKSTSKVKAKITIENR